MWIGSEKLWGISEALSSPRGSNLVPATWWQARDQVERWGGGIPLQKHRTWKVHSLQSSFEFNMPLFYCLL